ncbi:auxin efflux carrier [Hygrophoropsis aurantiaca]|uniref:Auxin efflux carrier n=1 Tax=Hygrophoropsis aurantiaca TaxID=72124 RepID=A0ACB7ZX37_9AGAM|nr:auxin efflux carrier [Hygrophoropsis aurantiaca]
MYPPGRLFCNRLSCLSPNMSSASESASTLIWVSVQPLIRLFLTAGCGFAITKAGLLPIIAARGAGQILLNITLPSLMFSKIVPAFNSQNIGALGPLIFVGLLYEAIGIVIAYIIKQFFWVPHRFRYGIVVAGGWGNVGDIPTSVVMSITAAAPFNGTEDENLAVAYIGAFLLVWCVTMFPMGGTRLIAQDFIGPDLDNEEVRHRMRIKRRNMMKFGRFISGRTRSGFERGHQKEELTDAEAGEKSIRMSSTAPYIQDSPTPTIQQRASTSEHTDDLYPAKGVAVESADSESPSPSTLPLSRRIAIQVYAAIRSILTPASLSIILSFIISVVPPLKALFVPGVPGTSIPPAPDGQPPLAIIMNTATFIGAASVPIGLMSLGSAMARLEVPKAGNWGTLPLGAIGALAVGRMILMPVLGVVICQGLTQVGIIDPANNVLRFVCIFLSCLPTATTQVFLTQVYSGTGTAEHLSAFLIPQYILMFITMTALTAYTLQLLFH